MIMVSAKAGVTNSNEKMMARRVISRSPFRIVVEHRKALSLDDDQASAHPRTSGGQITSSKPSIGSVDYANFYANLA